MTFFQRSDKGKQCRGDEEREFAVPTSCTVLYHPMNILLEKNSTEHLKAYVYTFRTSKEMADDF